MGWLDGKVALVTGGAAGIGRGVVDAFVAEGATVGVLDISAEGGRRLARDQPDVEVVQGDVTRIADNQRAVDALVQRHGRLDVLVTVAGLWDYFAALLDIEADRLEPAFDELFAVNVKGTLFAAHAAAPHLVRSEGAIVMTLSNAAFYAAGGGPLYTASKFATRGLVAQLAYELAPKVRVNGVAPGGTITELRGLRSLGTAAAKMSEVPDIEGLVRSVSPLGTASAPEDHAYSYVLLASNQRSPAITGTIIQSDGGIGVRGFGQVAGLAEPPAETNSD